MIREGRTDAKKINWEKWKNKQKRKDNGGRGKEEGKEGQKWKDGRTEEVLAKQLLSHTGSCCQADRRRHLTSIFLTNTTRPARKATH